MKKQQILFWIILLILIAQAVKIVINSYFLNAHFEIIPGLLEFKPVFPGKKHYSYVSQLIDKYNNVQIGLLSHLILFLVIESVVLFFYGYLRSAIPTRKKLLDIVFILQLSSMICALIDIFIWKNGTLDFIYLKPLFIFDIKDFYSTCFAVLFTIYASLVQLHNIVKIKKLKEYIKTNQFVKSLSSLFPHNE